MSIIFPNKVYLYLPICRRGVSFATTIRLNLEQYENTHKHKKLLHKVINDFESGIKSGVDGTPTFFINGKKYNGFNDFEGFYRACKYTFNINNPVLR